MSPTAAVATGESFRLGEGPFWDAPRDRLLWVDVQRNGQTVYTGAFAHWWQRSSATPAAAPTVKS